MRGDARSKDWWRVRHRASASGGVGLEWKDAEEDLLGHVRAAWADCGYGAAVVVGARGYDSDWDCELVVCVSDGLVYLSNGAS